jgi:hypothetical protein
MIKLYYTPDFILSVGFTLVMGVTLILLVVSGIRQHERDTIAESMTPIGCKFIGNAGKSSSIYFYDCNGKIEMKQVLK